MKKTIIIILAVLFLLINNVFGLVENIITHNQAEDGGTSTTIKAGIVVNFTNDRPLTKITKYAASTATDCYVYNTGGSQLRTGTYTGDTCTLSSSITLTANTKYYIVNDKLGASYGYRRKSSPVFPYDMGGYAKTQSGVYYSGSWTEDGSLIYEIYSLTILIPSASPSFTPYQESPLNNTHNNTNLVVYYNVTDNTGTSINCGLYINDTLNSTQTGVSVNTTLNFNIPLFIDGVYNYKIRCYNGTNESNTSLYSYYYDTTEPFIYITLPKEDNTTTFNYSNRSLQLDIYTTDQYLYKANLTIFNATGHQMYNNFSGDITGIIKYNWTSLIDISTWTVGHYDILIESTDSHTAKDIKDGFNPVKEKDTKIKYKTPKEWGDTEFSIEYTGNPGKITKFEDKKKFDRHSLNITFNKNIIKKGFREETFTITADKPLEYLSSSNIPCHIVSKDGMKGLWFDCVYEGIENDIYIVNKKTDYEYEITLITDNDELNFESLGGLNYNYKWVGFDILENLTIYANDTNTGLLIENFTVVYDGNSYTANGNKTIINVLANNSNSIQVSKTGYTTSITNVNTGFNPIEITFNLSSSGITLNFYDEINQTLLNFITTTIEVIGNITNTFTTSTGSKTISGLTSGDYQIRYYSPGYNPRNRYLNLNFSGISTYNLTLLKNSFSNVKTIKIIDQDSNIVENVLIKMFRSYPTGYKIVNEAYTNFEGETISNFVEDTTYYKFYIYNNNILLKETSETLISSGKTTLSIQIPITENQLQSIKYYLPAITSLSSPVNVSGKICYIYSYAGANIKGAKIEVYKSILSSNDILVVRNQSSLAAGNLAACFTPQSNYKYFIDAYIDTNTTNSFFPTEKSEYSLNNNINIFGLLGLFISYLIIVGMVLLSSGHPSGSVVMGIIGLIFVSIVGLFSIGYGAIVLIISVALIIIFSNKT